MKKIEIFEPWVFRFLEPLISMEFGEYLTESLLLIFGLV